MAKKKPRTHEELFKDVEQHGEMKASLTHEELLRASALAQACTYYINTIVKDGDLYREMVRDNRVLKPATYMGVIEVAFNFEAYVSGRLQKDLAAVVEETAVLTRAKKALEADAEKPEPSTA